MTQPRMVIVKFLNTFQAVEQRSRISSLVGDDLDNAEQLFPGDEDRDLATLWEVQLKANAGIERVLERLRDDKEIEYAHEPEERKGLETP